MKKSALPICACKYLGFLSFLRVCVCAENLLFNEFVSRMLFRSHRTSGLHTQIQSARMNQNRIVESFLFRLALSYRYISIVIFNHVYVECGRMVYFGFEWNETIYCEHGQSDSHAHKRILFTPSIIIIQVDDGWSLRRLSSSSSSFSLLLQ